MNFLNYLKGLFLSDKQKADNIKAEQHLIRPRLCIDLYSGVNYGFVHKTKMYLYDENKNPYAINFLAALLYLAHLKINNYLLYSHLLELISTDPVLYKFLNNKFYKEGVEKIGIEINSVEYLNYFREAAISDKVGNRAGRFVLESKSNDNKEWLKNIDINIKRGKSIKEFSNSDLENSDLDKLIEGITIEILRNK
jgi:hypothetical protein